jgi:uncharacterized membrane protein
MTSSSSAPDASPRPDPKLDLTHVTRIEFINAMAHLYRGELGEATAWRTRIDATSNWAIVLSATALSFVFADKSSERHVLIPIITLFVTSMLLMEARRYRFYDIWRTRARMLEINFYRPMLDGSAPTDADWAATLAHDLEWPHFHMPWWEAAGRRLRRNYQWIYGVLLASWLVLLVSHPTATTELGEIAARAAIGPISGRLSSPACLRSTVHWLRWASTASGKAGLPSRCRPVIPTACIRNIMDQREHFPVDG